MSSVQDLAWLTYMKLDIGVVNYDNNCDIAYILHFYRQLDLIKVSKDICIECLQFNARVIKSLYYRYMLNHIPLCTVHHENMNTMIPQCITVRKSNRYTDTYKRIHLHTIKIFNDTNIFKTLIRILLYQKCRYTDLTLLDTNPCSLCSKTSNIQYPNVGKVERFYICKDCHDEIWLYTDDTYVDIALISTYFINLFSRPLYDIIVKFVEPDIKDIECVD
jgi:hypothetical protein